MDEYGINFILDDVYVINTKPTEIRNIKEPLPIILHYCCKIEELTNKISTGEYTSEELSKLCMKIKQFANQIESIQNS
jgi:hypothetical protein